MYFLVKFKEGETEVVNATTHVKDFKKSIKYRAGDTIRVFWSPKESYTPNDVRKKQGHILDIDQTVSSIASVKKSKAGISDSDIDEQDLDSKTGYYEAELLQMEDTEDKLLEQIERKRIRQQSAKLKEASESGRILKAKSINKSSKKTNNEAEPKKAELKRLRESSSHANIDNLLGECSQSKKKKIVALAPSSSSDSGDDVILKGDLKQVEKERDKWKKSWTDEKTKNIALSSKIELLEEQLRTATEENIKLKVDLTLATRNQSTVMSPFKVSSPLRQSPRLKAQAEKKATTPTSSSVHVKKIDFGTEDGVSEAAVNRTEDDVPEAAVDKQKIQMEVNIDATTSAETEIPLAKQSAVEKEFKITEEQYASIKNGVTKGSAGDSLFVKNLAVAVFTTDVLMVSSVTGSECLARKNKEDKEPPKEKLPEKGLQLVKELFMKRAVEEGYDVTSSDYRTREKKVHSYIGKKISTLMRSSKKK
nr:PREDICTED: uncharacterized protein LOC109032039 [Bemisia tabaci]